MARTWWIVGGVVAVVVIAAAAVLAVGGGSDSEQSSAALTHDQYVAKANAICVTDLNRVLADADNRDLAAGARDLATAARHLEALKPPPDDRATVARFTRDIDLAADALKSVKIAQFQSQVAAAAKLAGQLDLDACQNGP